MSKEIEKIGLLARKQIVEDLKEKISTAEGCFFIGFNKIGAFAFNELRNNLGASGAKVFVSKNSLFRRALEALNWSDIDSLLNKESGVVLIYEKDIVKACKILVDFAKESEVLQLKGGTIQNKSVSSQDLQAMAKLPSKSVLLGLAVSGLAAPLSGFVNSLNQIILKFLWAIQEIKKQRDERKATE